MKWLQLTSLHSHLHINTSTITQPVLAFTIFCQSEYNAASVKILQNVLDPLWSKICRVPALIPIQVKVENLNGEKKKTRNRKTQESLPHLNKHFIVFL